MAKVVRNQPNYLLIGSFMFVGIFGVIVSVIFSNKLLYKLRGGYPLHVTFDDIDGLVPGSKVIVGGGKNIGQVDSIDIQGSTVVVKLLIDRKYKINKDVQFRIFSTSIVGGRYVAIRNYNGESPHISKGATVKGITPFSVNTIFDVVGGFFSSSTEEGNLTKGLGGIFTSLELTLSIVEGIVRDNRDNIDIAIKDLTKTAKQLNSFTGNLDRKLDAIPDKDFKNMVAHLRTSLKNLDTLLKDINSDNAPLSLLKDPNITQSLKAIVSNVEEATERVKAKPSLLLKG